LLTATRRRNTLRASSAKPPKNLPGPWPDCRKAFGNFSGQISYKDDESNSQMKTPIRFLFTLLCAAIASFLLVLALLPPAHASSSPPGNVAAQTGPTMTMRRPLRSWN